MGIEAAGKMASLNPGMWPITDGPRMIPPMTSAMTRGWRILDRGQCRIWQTMTMRPTCMRLCQHGHDLKNKRRSTDLDNEDGERVLWIVHGRVCALQDTALGRDPDGRGRRSRSCRRGRHCEKILFADEAGGSRAATRAQSWKCQTSHLYEAPTTEGVRSRRADEFRALHALKLSIW